MPGIDDRLERDLERAARPAAPDPGGTLEDVARRRARRTLVRKTQTVALVAVVLLGTAAGFLALQRNFTGANIPQAGSTSAPSPSTTAGSASENPSPSTTMTQVPGITPLPLPEDPTQVFDVGLAFPVCRGSMITGNFLGTGQTYAYVFTKGSDGGCVTDTTVVAVQVPSDAGGTSSALVTGGPLDCQDPSACFVYANPDINADGQDEIAIVTTQGASTTFFELYEATHTSNGWGLNPFIDDKGFPIRFAEGGSVTHLDGVYCDDTSGQRRFVSWGATTADGSTYDITETFYEVQDGQLVALAPHHLTSPADALPPSDLGTCGGSVQSTSSP